jgi:hypothetical protein
MNKKTSIDVGKISKSDVIEALAYQKEMDLKEEKKRIVQDLRNHFCLDEEISEERMICDKLKYKNSDDISSKFLIRKYQNEIEKNENKILEKVNELLKIFPEKSFLNLNDLTIVVYFPKQYDPYNSKNDLFRYKIYINPNCKINDIIHLNNICFDFKEQKQIDSEMKEFEKFFDEKRTRYLEIEKEIFNMPAYIKALKAESTLKTLNNSKEGIEFLNSFKEIKMIN